MSVLEIWGAEYQENDCLLIKPESRNLLQAICDRERCFMQVGVGCAQDCLPQGLVPAAVCSVACCARCVWSFSCVVRCCGSVCV